MRVILINLFSDKLTNDDFNFYTEEFSTICEVFNYQFSVQEMFPDIVEVIINNIRQEAVIDISNTVIILQTNVADIAHFSAKFYAELLDEIIIVTKNVELLTETHKDFKFLLNVLQTDIKETRIHKIYIQDNGSMDINYLKFIYIYRLFNELAPVSELIVEKSKKLRFDTIFLWDEGAIETNFAIEKKKIIQLKKTSDEGDIVLSVVKSYGIFLLLQFIMNLNSFSINDKVYFSQRIVTHAVSSNKGMEVREYIINFLDSQVDSLQEFADYNYICMLLGDKLAIERQFKFLIKNYNKLNPSQVLSLITNSLFYETKLNQISYVGLVNDRLLLMEKLNWFWRRKIQLPKAQKRFDNRIAIVAGQLLSINHAPTKWAIDYANMLKKYNPKLEIKIFVEDWASYSPDELTWMNAFSSVNSSTCQQEHREHLHPEIEVYYSNNKLERKKRIQQDVTAISSFQPSLIYKMGSKYNLVVDLLYPYFPIISHTMGGAEDCNFVDIFTGGYLEHDMKRLYSERKLTTQEYYSHRIGLETPKSTGIKNREMYKLSDVDFVMVTVGNRLESEITKEFIDQIIEVLEVEQDIKWVIVGTKSISLINQNYKSYIDNNRIIFIPYEENLFDFYKICDIYVNPVRQAGGNSAALAMKSKLPIVTSNPTSDVGGLSGKENCIDLELFSQEILKLKVHTKYYKEKSYEMLNRIDKNHSFVKTNEDLKQIFEVAIQKFNKRNSEK